MNNFLRYLKVESLREEMKNLFFRQFEMASIGWFNLVLLKKWTLKRYHVVVCDLSELSFERFSYNERKNQPMTAPMRRGSSITKSRFMPNAQNKNFTSTTVRF